MPTYKSIMRVKVKKVKHPLKEAIKTQSGNKGIVLLFL
jgi:hypothetical protein